MVFATASLLTSLIAFHLNYAAQLKSASSALRHRSGLYPMADQAVANSRERSAVKHHLEKVCIGVSDISLPHLKLAQLLLVKEAVYRPWY